MRRAWLGASLGLWLSVASATQSPTPPPRPTGPRLVQITPTAEPGKPLRFTGIVYDYSGRPLENAAVIVHQTNAAGLYNPPNSPTRVPRLRAVSVTDAQGRFGFSTIWPGAYPDGDQPAHIHFEVAAPAHTPRYLEVWFEGDPKISASMRRRAEGNDTLKIVRPTPDATGVPHFTFDVRLEGN